MSLFWDKIGGSITKDLFYRWSVRLEQTRGTDGSDAVEVPLGIDPL